MKHQKIILGVALLTLTLSAEAGPKEDCETALQGLGYNLSAYVFLITTQAKRNLSSRSGIGGVLSAT